MPQPKKGLEKVMIRLEPAQARALRDEALRRASERGTIRPEVSEHVREAIDAWLAKRRRR